MKMKVRMEIRTSKRMLVPKCTDCGVALVRNSNELMCPKCGLVEDIVE
jgi:uncharacterized Zn finger protein (UPF0148 family)